MDHPWARSDGVKIGGTYVKVRGMNKIVGIVTKSVGPVPKQVGSFLKLSEFVFSVKGKSVISTPSSWHNTVIPSHLSLTVDGKSN